MVAFSDANLSDCKNSLTTCGYVICLFGVSIAWKTQSSFALSTCQAEYVAMNEASQEFMSMYNSLKFILGKNLFPMVLYCDNLAAQVCAKTGGNNKLRHMAERREHYVKQCVSKNYVKIEWISSKDQLSDIFTKALTHLVHERLTFSIFNMSEI